MVKGTKTSKVTVETKQRINGFKYKLIKKKFNEKKINSSKNLHQKSTKIKQKVEKENDINIANKEPLYKNIEKYYMLQSLNNYYELYSDNNLKEILTDSRKCKYRITPEILCKYDLNVDIRSHILNFFYNFIESNNISFKYYFYSVSIFDNFLINFSEDESNIDRCQKFFKSKVTNQLSETKLVLYILCCYYVYSKFYSSNLFTINHILQIENAKNESTFDDLSNLIIDIINYTNDIDSINIYSFIDLYMFKIRKCFYIYEDENQYFINGLEKSINFFAAKIGKSINFSEIDESLKALAIIIFSYNLCNNMYKQKNGISMYINHLLNNFKLSLINYFDICQISIIIKWLNDNWCI